LKERVAYGSLETTRVAFGFGGQSPDCLMRRDGWKALERREGVRA